MSTSISQPRSTAVTPRQSGPQLEGLCRGSRGPDVVALQQQLNAKGAKLDVDGKFGPLTEAALKQFQTSSGCGGNGRVNAETVGALKTPTTAETPSATPAATTTTTTTTTAPAPAADTISSGGGTCAAPKAAPMPTASSTPATTTTATTTAPEGLKLSETQTKAAVDTIRAGRTQAQQEKAMLGEVKSALQREIQELETPVEGKAATVADEAVLMGRRGQLDAVTKADELVGMKLQGFDAAETAIKDGVLTEVEAKALTDVQSAYATSEQAIGAQVAAATSLVDKGIAAGGRGKPTLGLKKKEEAAADAAKPAGTAVDVAAGMATINAAKENTKGELSAIATARQSIQTEAYSLQRLTDRTPADDAVLQGRLAQLKLLDGAKENAELRLQGLDAAATAIGDGVLTDDESKKLATIDAGIAGGQKALLAQASLASEMIRMGLAAGGRGSSDNI